MTTAFLRVFILVTFVISAAMSGTTVVSRIPIDGELEIPNGDSATNIQITLNGGEYTALSRIDGKFTFHDVPTGIYLLDVLSIHQVFSQMKLKVSAEENIVSVVEFKYPGAMRMQASYPLKMRAIAPLSYFQPRVPFSIIGMLIGNPMIVIMLVMVGVVVLFPDVLKQITENEDFKKGVDGQKGLQRGDPMNAFKKAMGMEVANDDDDDE